MSNKEDSSHGSRQGLMGFKVPDELARVPDPREMGRARSSVRRIVLKFMVLYTTLFGAIAMAQTKDQIEARNKAVVQAGFDAWNAGTGSPYDLLAENASWTIVGHSAASKTYSSKEAFISEMIRPFNARMKVGLKPTIRNIYAEGDTVTSSSTPAERRRMVRPTPTPTPGSLTCATARSSKRSRSSTASFSTSSGSGSSPSGEVSCIGYTTELERQAVSPSCWIDHQCE